jgi:hypothetical protein
VPRQGTDLLPLLGGTSATGSGSAFATPALAFHLATAIGSTCEVLLCAGYCEEKKIIPISINFQSALLTVLIKLAPEAATWGRATELGDNQTHRA